MFENFISLGWFCGTAASMSKYGIRSCSGPFDWYFSNFSGVLACMENDFADFLDKNNLVLLDGSPKEFLDTKYGFHYNHEVTSCFEEDYDSIYDKYARRVKKFKKMIRQKTCFIRAVKDSAELKYIQDNHHMIEKNIKKTNPESEIIYVVSDKEVTCEDLEFPFFVVNSIYDGTSRNGLRSLFDKNIELQQFCIKNYDVNMRYRNLYFDLQDENHRIEPMAAKYELLMHIDDINLTQQIVFSEIIIYGAGIVGKYLYQKVKGICRVRCFVDKHVREISYEGVPIIAYGDFIKQENVSIPIIVTVYSYNDVRAMLIIAGKSNIISVEEFLHEMES